jgi:hypothetical protein
MRRAVIGCLLGVVLVTMAGCVVVPIPAPPRESDFILTQQAIEFLSEPGATKAEVIKRLGYPYFPAPGRNVSLQPYSWRSGYALWAWSLGGGSGDMGAEPLERTYTLLIQYDENDTVIRYGVYGSLNKIFQGRRSYQEIIEDWLTDPLPDYFKPIKLPNKKPEKQEE